MSAEAGAAFAAHLLRAPPLLVASAALWLFGAVWTSILLVRYCPWLLPFLASLACLAMHIVLMVAHHGLQRLLPSGTKQVLELSVFQILQKTAQAVLPTLSDCIRLVLLATADLEEERRKQIVRELRRDFRTDVFQRPAWVWLPHFLQHLLFGSLSLCDPAALALDKGARTEGLTGGEEFEDVEEETGQGSAVGLAGESGNSRRRKPRSRSSPPPLPWPPATSSPSQPHESPSAPPAMPRSRIKDRVQLFEASQQSPKSSLRRRAQMSPAKRKDILEEGAIERHSSVNEILRLMQDAAYVASEVPQSSVLQQIINEKVADQAAMAFVHGGQRQFEMYLRDPLEMAAERVTSFTEAVTRPPETMLLRVPWEATRLTFKFWTLPVRFAASVLAGDKEHPDAAKEQEVSAGAVEPRTHISSIGDDTARKP